MTDSGQGTVVISLDTEMAWGTFDTPDGLEKYEEAYRRTPEIVRELCSLFEEYDISATWAVVAHLFEDCDGHHDFPTVDFEWIDDWYGSLPCQTGVDRDLWYAPEILDTIQSCSVEQEIGLHGYSHLILGDSNCPRHAAEYELNSAMAVLEQYGVKPSSFVFPRNKIGHRDVLADAGIEVCRGRDDVWFEQWHMPRLFRKPFRFANEALSRTPPAVAPQKQDGLVEVRGSQAFRPFHSGWQFTPEWTRVSRAKKGIDWAVNTGKVFHMHFHPFDCAVGNQEVLSKLSKVLKYVAEKCGENKLKVKTLSEIKRETYARTDTYGE